MKILIIDDDPNQLYSLDLSLRSKGHAVLTAGNDLDPITIIKEHASTVDVILSDYSMPGINGLGVLHYVTQHYSGLPVIIMTAYGSKTLLMDAIQMGCAGFIEKPFTLGQLLAELDRVSKQTD